MLLIYCATPLRMANMKEKIMDFVTSCDFGPFHPFQVFEIKRLENGPIGREKTMEFCLRAIEICDEFWIFGILEGTLIELEHARKIKKPINFFLNFDERWQKEYEKLKSKFNNALEIKIVGYSNIPFLFAEKNLFCYYFLI